MRFFLFFLGVGDEKRMGKEQRVEGRSPTRPAPPVQRSRRNCGWVKVYSSSPETGDRKNDGIKAESS